MIAEYIADLKDKQKEFYVGRQSILEAALSDKRLSAIEYHNRLSSKSLEKVRDYVLWLEWEENSASFDEWTLSWVEDFSKVLLDKMQEIIANTENSERFNEDFVKGMQKLYDLIK